MKNLSAVVICLFLFIAGCNMDAGGDGGSLKGDDLVPGAGAEDYTAQDYEAEYKMWQQSQTPFADADKTEQGVS